MKNKSLLGSATFVFFSSNWKNMRVSIIFSTGKQVFFEDILFSGGEKFKLKIGSQLRFVAGGRVKFVPAV